MKHHYQHVLAEIFVLMERFQNISTQTTEFAHAEPQFTPENFIKWVHIESELNHGGSWLGHAIYFFTTHGCTVCVHHLSEEHLKPE